jgi:dTDP-4-dehydrorhamnose 3,5-epimerase
MNVIETKLQGVLIIEPEFYFDSRGFFKETFQAQRYREAGIEFDFVQDNISRSQKGVLRGLHFQITKPQGKLVSCTQGAVFDVAVDVAPLSATFGQYVGIELTEDNHRQFWVPPGYAHGFCVLTDTADFQYKCTDYYDPFDEGGLIWNDSDVAIEWPIDQPLISNKDSRLPTLKELANQL